MAGEYLTDQDPIAFTDISLSDVMHLVDVSDTTNNPAGESFKATLFNLLLSRTFVWSSNALILRRSSTSANTEPRDGDWVMFMSETRLVIGIAQADIGVGTMPTSLDDPALFKKLLDNTP